MATIVRVKGIEKLSGGDLKSLVRAANWIGINPDWLASVISFETAGTFDPAKPNAAGSGAVGLIQFMPSTAERLGTTTSALKRMSFAKQLEYVKAYFAPYKGYLHSLQDTYLAVFYPVEIGKSPGDVIATEGSKIYEQNRGFDSSGKGYITREDVTSTIVSVLNRGLSNPRIRIPLFTSGVVMATGLTGFLGYRLYEGKRYAV